MIRIALIDDNVALLDQLKKEFETVELVEIMFTATDGQECMRLLDIIQPAHLPHIILMDISMPKLDGIHATAQITQKYPFIQVVIFTTFEDDDKILACIQAGAKGYLLKTEKMAFVCHTLEEVMQGGSQMSPSIARKVLRLMQNTSIQTHQPATPIDVLTTRENEVLELVKKGQKYKKIAEALGIEETTVKKHIRNIYEKMGVHDKFGILQIKT